MGQLNAVINEAETERLRQKKECEVVVSERDILGTQLVRRNDELALLYEKIKIQQVTCYICIYIYIYIHIYICINMYRYIW